jgi:phosphoglycerate dehydrogenase-like enzyme
MVTPSRIIFIGAPEADATEFAARARADLPGIELFATNDRALALEHGADAEALIGHHFQFDEELVSRAPRLRWIQSLTTGTDAILKLKALRPEVTVTSPRHARAADVGAGVSAHAGAHARFPAHAAQPGRRPLGTLAAAAALGQDGGDRRRGRHF